MNRIIYLLIILSIFLACSSPGDPNKEENTNVQYSLILNHLQLMNEQSCALAIIDDSGNLKKIGEGIARANDFSFTEDGSIVVYRSHKLDNISQPYIVISDIVELSDILLNMENATEPKISPDGNYIAYLQGSFESNQDTSGLYIMNTNGMNSYKLLNSLEINSLLNWGWSSDSKGIIFEVYTAGYNTYYIDKDRLNNPIETDPWPRVHDSFDQTYFSLNGFERASLPVGAIFDSIGFYYYQIDNQEEKAWKNIFYSRFNGNQLIKSSYLLGYDFIEKTERFLIDSTITTSDIKVVWSPDYNNIGILTHEGIHIVKVDGTDKKIFNYTIDGDINSTTKLKWIKK